MSRKTTEKLSALTIRIPSWDIQDMEDRNCPLCRDPGEKRFIRPDNLNVKECSCCATFFISPAPSESNLLHFYSSYYSQYRKTDLLADAAVIKEILTINPFADFRNKILTTLTGGLQGKKALDIGFGRGDTMVGLKKLGAMVTGIDLDDDAIRLAKTKLNIPDVHQCRIEDYTPQERFDLITMYDFIEHPIMPMPAFQKACGLLNPGGLLAIYTPNATFIDHEKEPICFRIDLEHMQYLTIRSCHYLANSSRLEIVHLESLGFPILPSFPKKPSLSASLTNYLLNYSTMIKNVFRLLPAFKRMNQIRKAVWAMPPDIRQGSYCLFCVFKTK